MASSGVALAAFGSEAPFGLSLRVEDRLEELVSQCSLYVTAVGIETGTGGQRPSTGSGARAHQWHPGRLIDRGGRGERGDEGRF